jgi:hypothetical protein
MRNLFDGSSQVRIGLTICDEGLNVIMEEYNMAG